MFGIPDKEWGEQVNAVIEPAEGVEADDALAEEILAFCAGKLAKFKTPKTIDFTSEMPRDPNGKLYKRKLRDPYWEGRAAGGLTDLAVGVAPAVDEPPRRSVAPGTGRRAPVPSVLTSWPPCPIGSGSPTPWPPTSSRRRAGRPWWRRWTGATAGS